MMQGINDEMGLGSKEIKAKIHSLDKEFVTVRQNTWEIQKQIAPLVSAKSTLLQRERDILKEISELQEEYKDQNGEYYSILEGNQNERSCKT